MLRSSPAFALEANSNSHALHCKTMRNSISSWRLKLEILIVVFATSTLVAADRKIEFNRDIRPILSNNCYQCHGPDKNQLQAGLRLDKHETATAKLESGHTALVPGDLSASGLIDRMISSDPNLKMPPHDSGKSLTAAEIETLKSWILQGAEYQGHW